jgi:hypothetical protein
MMAILVLITPGCTGERTSSEPSSRSKTAGAEGDASATTKPPTTGVTKLAVPHEPWWHVSDVESLPTDEYKNESRMGRYNASREQRRMSEADRVLADFRVQLARKSPEELINLICIDEVAENMWYGKMEDPADPLSGSLSPGHAVLYHGSSVAYYVARDGNELIQEELARRGAKARQVLQSHCDDDRQVFTGVSGPRQTIGTMCEELLRALGDHPAQ